MPAPISKVRLYAFDTNTALINLFVWLQFCEPHLLQILHEKVHDTIVEKLKKAYAQVRIGDPLEGNIKFYCIIDK